MLLSNCPSNDRDHRAGEACSGASICWDVTSAMGSGFRIVPVVAKVSTTGSILIAHQRTMVGHQHGSRH